MKKTTRTPTLLLDRRSRLLYANGVPIDLTPSEYSVLDALLARGGAVVGGDELIDDVWGREAVVRPDALASHIYRLRRKIRAHSVREPIETIRGKGYRITATRTR